MSCKWLCLSQPSCRAKLIQELHTFYKFIITQLGFVSNFPVLKQYLSLWSLLVDLLNKSMREKKEFQSSSVWIIPRIYILCLYFWVSYVLTLCCVLYMLKTVENGRDLSSLCMEMERQKTIYVAWGCIESPSLDVLGRNLREQAN